MYTPEHEALINSLISESTTDVHRSVLANEERNLREAGVSEDILEERRLLHLTDDDPEYVAAILEVVQIPLLRKAFTLANILHTAEEREGNLLALEQQLSPENTLRLIEFQRNLSEIQGRSSFLRRIIESSQNSS